MLFLLCDLLTDFAEHPGMSASLPSPGAEGLMCELGSLAGPRWADDTRRMSGSPGASGISSGRKSSCVHTDEFTNDKDISVRQPPPIWWQERKAVNIRRACICRFLLGNKPSTELCSHLTGLQTGRVGLPALGRLGRPCF